MSLLLYPINVASIPVVRLAVSEEYKNETCLHFHMSEKKNAREDARKNENQQYILNELEKIFNKIN
jgi:hypothetical protein